MGAAGGRDEEVRLSRTVSHALRHDPARYGLTLDADGWAGVGDLLAALRRQRSGWARLDRSDLERMIARSDKPRFELTGDRIRARYGHSLPGKVPRLREPPPPLLYHGTTPEAAPRILAEGLRPMGRQYVHLSTDERTAREVGRRRTRRPVVLAVRAGAAHAAGVPFYRGEAGIWLADHVPPDVLMAMGHGAPGERSLTEPGGPTGTPVSEATAGGKGRRRGRD